MTSKIESIEWPNCLLSNLKRNYAETIYDQEYLYIYLFNKAKKIYFTVIEKKKKDYLVKAYFIYIEITQYINNSIYKQIYFLN